MGYSKHNLPWTPEEDELLRKHYPSEAYKLLVLLPNRTRNAMHRRAAKLDIKMIPRPFAPDAES